MIVVYPQFFFLPVIKDTDIDENDLYRVFNDMDNDDMEEYKTNNKEEPKNLWDIIDDEYVKEETSKKYNK